jgi:anti-sigma B factor antagonist
LDFTSEIRNGILIIEMNVRRATVDLAAAFKDLLVGEIEKGTINVVINLSYVEFVDSSFLGSLAAGLRVSTADGGDIKIAGVHPHVRMTFEVTNLDKVFKIYHSVDEAIRAF